MFRSQLGASAAWLAFLGAPSVAPVALVGGALYVTVGAAALYVSAATIAIAAGVLASRR